MGTAVSLVGALILEDINFNLNWTDWLLAMYHCGTFSVIFPMQMYISSTIPGVIFTLIGTTSVLYALISQYTILRAIHAGNHNWMEMLGVGLVAVCVICPAVIKILKQRRKDNEKPSKR